MYKRKGDPDVHIFFHLYQLNTGLLPGTFTVELSIQGNPDKPGKQDKIFFAGSISTFENSFPDACENCTDRKPQQIRGRIEMAAALADAGWDLAQIENAEVDPVQWLAFLGVANGGTVPRNLAMRLRGPGATGRTLDLGPWGISVGRLGPEASLQMIQEPPSFDADGVHVFRSLKVLA
jgi:hypothetical protein